MLYADIVNFTLISSYHSATEVVNLLNYLFCLIDKLTDKYEAFKADTVGDAYVAVTGLPTCGTKTTSESVTNIAHLALEMLGQLNNLDHENESMCEVKLRIGLATGPVSVGMIGMKIPKYCVFGETVNMATAMEERSQAMRILITKYTRNFLADTGLFETLFRGQFKIDDTIVDTYWLVGSSCIDKDLDIFHSDQPKKGGGILNKRIKQQQLDQQRESMDTLYTSAPMIPRPYNRHRSIPATQDGSDVLVTGGSGVLVTGGSGVLVTGGSEQQGQAHMTTGLGTSAESETGEIPVT